MKSYRGMLSGLYYQAKSILLIAVMLVTASLETTGQTTVTIGSGTLITGASSASPVNIYFRSQRSQIVYTAAEIYQAGGYPGLLTELGFYVDSSPIYGMPNYRIRLAHTTASDVSVHITPASLQQVYQNPLYTPGSGGFQMMTFDTPFNWNGVDNILVDICFDQVLPTYNSSGRVRYYSQPNGYRYIWSDGSNQCGNNTSNVISTKPQVQLSLAPQTPNNAGITDFISPLSNCGLGGSEAISIIVQNAGTDTIQQLDATYVWNQGAAVTETFTLSIPPAQVDTITFISTADAAAYGTYDLVAYVSLAGDTLPQNDTLSTSIEHIPYFTVSEDSLDFGSLFVGGNIQQSVTLINGICQSVNLIGATTSDPAFTVGFTAGVIPAEDSAAISITFSPSTISSYGGILVVQTDVGNDTIVLDGTGIGAPLVSISPDSLSTTINSCDDSVTLSIQVTNNGLSPLEFGFPTIDSSSVLDILALTYGYYQPYYQNTQTAILQSYPLSQFIEFSSTDSSQLRQALAGKDLILVPWLYSSTTYSNAYLAYGPVIQDFVSNGGSIIFTGTSNSASIFNSGMFSGTNGGSIVSGNTMSLLDATHPLLDGIPQWVTPTTTYFLNLQAGSDATALAVSPLDANDVALAYRNIGAGQAVFIGSGYFSNYAIHDQLTENAVAWATGLPEWISISPDSGTVAVGATTSIDVSLYSADLGNGSYAYGIPLATNDPLNAIVNIPVSLTVNGTAEISLSDSCLDYGQVMQLTTVLDTFEVINTGCDTLIINNITTSDAAYAAVFSAVSLLPGDTAAFPVSFSPQLVQSYPAILTINTNVGLDTLCLNGVGTGAPVLSVGPDSLSATINSCDDSVTVSIQLANNGLGDLVFEVEQQPTSSSSFEVLALTYGYYSPYYTRIRNAILQDYPLAQFTEYSLTDSALLRQALVGKAMILVPWLYSSSTTNNVYTAFGPVIQEFVTNGGGIVFTGTGSTGTIFNSGIFAGTYLGQLGSGASVVLNDPTHPLLEGVSQWTTASTTYLLSPQPGTGTTILAERFGFTNQGTLLYREIGAGKAVFIGSAYNVNNSTEQQLVANAAGWVVGLPGWLNASPDSGTVVVGGSVPIDVTLTSTGLNNGTYVESLQLTTNDPLNPIVNIPVSLTVNGIAEITLSDSCLDYGSVMQFTTVLDTFKVLNTGCDTLIISGVAASDSAYAAVFSPVSLLPGDTVTFPVNFSPQLVQSYPAILTISTNVGTDTLCLNGTGIGAPVVSVSPDSLSATINSCDDSVTVSFSIANTGLGDLVVEVEQQITASSSIEVLVLTYGYYPPYYTRIQNAILQDYPLAQFTEFALTDSALLRQALVGKEMILVPWLYSSSTTNNVYTAFGPVIEDFVSNGGGIVFTGTGSTGAIFNSGIFAGTYLGQLGSGASIVLNDPTHPLLEGISQWTTASTTYLLSPQPGTGTTILAERFGFTNQGTLLYREIGAGKAVFIGSAYNVNNSTEQQLVANAAGWVVGLLDWLSTSIDSGTVAVGDSMQVDVTMASNGLNNGTYIDLLQLATNDPIHPYLNIPVSLTVDGPAEITLSDSCLTYPAAMQFTTASDTVMVYNPGCDSLEVTQIQAIGDAFSAGITAFTIAPGDSLELPILFSPDTVGGYLDTLTFSSNGGTASLCVSGSGTGAPSVSVSPTALNVVIPGCADSLTVPLMVYNSGLSGLNWSIFGFGGFDSTSFQNYVSTGQATTHTFSGLPGIADSLYVVITMAGDFDGTGEFAELIIEGGTPTQIQDGIVSNGTPIVNTYVFSGQQAAGWLADGSLSIVIDNNSSVNVFSGEGNYHQVQVLVNGSSWLSGIPTTASTPIGDSTLVEVTISSENLIAGTYQQNLLLQSNDPLNPILSIPVSLTITGAVSIALSAPQVVFDSTMLGFTDQQSLTLYNSLCDTMVIPAMTNNNTVFGFTANLPITVAPFDSVVIPLTFSPAAITPYLDSLFISYQAIDSAAVLDTFVVLQGEGIGTPVLDFAPDSLNATLNACLDSISFPVTIYSNGTGTLDWSTALQSSSVALSDNFDSGTNAQLWSQIDGGNASNPLCGTASGLGALYFNGGYRAATTVPINTFAGGSVNFSLKIGSGGSPCENADPGEEIVLEYATSGQNWTLLEEYSTTAFTSFTTVQAHIPTAAQGANTSFRWRQKSNSGSCCDHWSIDEVYFVVGTDSSLQVSVAPDAGTTLPGDSIIVIVTVNVNQLANGVYPLQLVLSSNDPLDSLQYIPGLITITGQPEILLADSSQLFPADFCFDDSLLLQSDVTGNLLWSTGETTNSIFINQSDTIQVTLTYPNGCSIASRPVVVNELPELTSSIVLSGSGAGCAGNLLDLTVTGGSPPFSYAWSTGGTSQDITINTTGLYTVAITDSKGCVLTDSLHLDSLVAITMTTLVTPLSCFGAGDGSIDLIVNGGDFPYTYSWSNGATSEDVSLLAAGSYSVVVTDANGCTAQATVSVSQPNNLTVFTYKNNVTCYGSSDGAAFVYAYGGTAPYTYLWSTGATSQNIDNLAAGSYSVTVSDLNGCSDTRTIVITEPTPISINITQTDSCGLADLNMTPSGGPGYYYNYLWSTGATSQNISNLQPGTYWVKVSTWNGCFATDTITITTVPPPPVPQIALSGNSTLCPGDSIILTSSSLNDIIWSTGDTNSSITVSQSGLYSVTVSDTNGCTSTSDPVQVQVLPEATIIASANPICNGQTISLSVSNATSVLWSTGDTSLSISVSPGVATMYSIGAVNDSGCAFVDTMLIDVLPAAPPAAVGNMLPLDGAANLAVPVAFSWSSAANAAVYDLYWWPVGQSQPANPLVSGITQIQYTGGGLFTYGTTYNWTVVARNNCFSTPGPVQTFTIKDLPDLVADTVIVPSGAVFAGQNICVNWRIVNQGLGTSGNTVWTERVYLSQNLVFDGLDQLVATQTSNSSLNAGDTSSLRTACFDLPSCILGTYYVFVVVDYGNSVLESDELNNLAINTLPLNVNLPPQPDLEVTQFFRIGSGSLASGSQVCLRWVITNTGDSLTNTANWSDRLYLSQDSVFDAQAAIQAWDIAHSGILAPLQSYQVDTCVNLPGNADGPYYLFVETDIFNEVDECSPGFINEQNNVSDGDTIQTFLAPPANLIVTNVSGIPATLTAGNNFTLTWNTENTGFSQTFVSTWSERVSLIPVGGGNPINFPVQTFSTTLTAGASFPRTQTLTIPGNLSGDFTVCVQVDVFNQVYEFTFENDNEACAAGTLQIIKPDLSIGSITFPAIDSTGNTFSVNYWLNNNGPANLAAFTLQDRLYWTRPNGTFVATAATPVYTVPALASGDSISRSVSVSVPGNITGQLNLCIRTDNYNGISETNETNNIACAGPLEIRRPDLVVASVQAPSIIQAGDTFSISWTPSNAGNAGLYLGSWTDCLFLSATPVYSPASLISIGQLNYSATLLAGQDTTFQIQVVLSPNLAGTYYLGVFTDCNNTIDEPGNEGNNVSILPNPIQVVVPDLLISQINLPAIDSTGQPLQISWVEKNMGQGDLVNRQGETELYWQDGQGGSIPLSSLNWTISLLESGDSIIRQTFVNAPQAPGPYFLCIKADASQVIVEESEANNLTCSDSLRIFRPDFVVNSIITPTAVTAAQPFAVDWIIGNQGEVGANNGYWSDCLILSPTSTYDPNTAISVGQLSYGTTLNAGGSSARSTTVSTPYGLSGTYYLGVFTDCGDAVDELDQETNNLTFSTTPILISPAPAPDLIPTISGLLPDSLTAGSPFTLDYVVNNQGDTTAQGFNWYEGIFLTNTPNWAGNPNNAMLLDSVQRFQPLAVGNSYSQQVILPTSPYLPAGWYYVYVHADFQGNIYEAGLDGNNWTGDSIYIRAYPPVDIKAISLTASAAAVLTGNSISITYQGQNTGQALPIPGNWIDGAYLSTDSLWSTDDDLVSFWTVPGQVPPGMIYSRTQQITIPNGYTPGTYWLLVRADAFLANENDSDTTNNYIGQPLQVNLTPYPDLRVQAFTAPATAIAGQPFSVSYTVENDPTTFPVGSSAGPTTTGGWSEGFYLSTDLVLGPGDILIGSAPRSGNLLPGQTYGATVNLTIPQSVAVGNYILLMKTDRNNIVFENQNEGNNVSVISPFTLQQSPPADLRVTQIVRPDTALAGKSMQVSWTVQNVGGNPASGAVSHGVYLSSDTLLSSDDALFGVYSGFVNLLPQASAAYSITSDVLGVTEGDFYVLVRTDILNNIAESDEENNRTASNPFFVQIPLLPFDVLTPDTLANNQELYYRILVDSSQIGQSMIVSLTGDSVNNAFNEQYLRYDEAPSRSIYDHTVTFPFLANQNVVAPDIRFGTYYLMNYGTTPAASEQNVTLLAEILPFEIRKVMANYGGNTGPVTVKIEGGQFEQGMEARLENSALGTIIASNVIFINPTAVWATFDLIGRPIGVYDVVLEKFSLADTALLDTGFTVQQGPANGFIGGGGLIGGGNVGRVCVPAVSDVGQLLQVVIDHPANTRLNQINSFTIYYENIGNIDLPVPTRMVVSNQGAFLGFTPAELAEEHTEIFLEFTESGSPPGILRPGGRGSITIYTESSAPMDFTLLE